MKLICAQDHWPAKAANMLGFGAKPRTKIAGITQGKEYSGTPVTDTTGSIMGGIGDVSSTTQFLIFNDNKEWEHYQLDLFQPVETE